MCRPSAKQHRLVPVASTATAQLNQLLLEAAHATSPMLTWPTANPVNWCCWVIYVCREVVVFIATNILQLAAAGADLAGLEGPLVTKIAKVSAAYATWLASLPQLRGVGCKMRQACMQDTVSGRCVSTCTSSPRLHNILATGCQPVSAIVLFYRPQVKSP